MDGVMERSRLAAGIAGRIRSVDESWRSRLLARAAGLADVIALGRGDPDFHTPRHIVEAAKRAIDANEHHYTAPAGLPALREAIAGHLRARFGLDYAADEVIVTAGAQEAVMLTALAFVNPGDEVLMPAPRFTSYDTAVALCGGLVVDVPTRQEDDFALVPAEVAARITPRTKAIVLVSPNNPTGAVTPPPMVREIARLAIAHDLLVVADEIYAEIIFEGSEHLSIATLPGMRGRTVTLNGFSKTYAMTGWRVGYLAAPRDAVARLIEPRHTLSINAATPSQFAALAALTGPQDEVLAMREAYAARRVVMLAALDRLGLSYGNPGGAFYVYANVSPTGMTAPEFCEALLAEARVLIFPGALFADPGDTHVRISLLQPIPRIEEAFARIEAARGQLFRR
jgi:aminotransferase